MRSWRPSCPHTAALNPQLRVTCKGILRWRASWRGDPASPAPKGSEGSWTRSMGRGEPQIWKSPRQVLGKDLYLLWDASRGPLGGNGFCCDPAVVFGRSGRRDYIVAKYVEHRFARRSTPEPQRLWTAICNRDLLLVLEAFANGQDFRQPLSGPEGQVRTPSKGHL